MSESFVARVRDRLNRYTPREWSAPFTPVEDPVLAVLLDIAEAMAARDPVDWYGERACLYCRVNIGDGDDHEPNCPHIRARELCGIGGDK